MQAKKIIIFLFVFAIYCGGFVYADISRLENQKVIFGNAGGFVSKQNISGDNGNSNPNAEGAGIELLQIDGGPGDYFTKDLKIDGTFVEILPDDWKNLDGSSPVVTSDNFNLWPKHSDTCGITLDGCESDSEWIFDVANLNIGDFDSDTPVDALYLGGTSEATSAWFDLDNKSTSAVYSNFIPTFNLFIGNTSSLMLGLSGQNINAFGIKSLSEANVDGGTDYVLRSMPIYFQPHEASLLIGKTKWDSGDDKWKYKNPVLAFIPSYKSENGGSSLEEKGLMVVNGVIPAAEVTIYGDLKVNGNMAVSEFGVNAYDNLGNDDAIYNVEDTGSIGDEIVLASTTFDVYFVTHNLLILGSASSAPVDTGSHTISKLYLRVSRYSNGAYQTVDYDVSNGTWSNFSGDYSGAGVFDLTMNEFDGSGLNDASNQVTFFSGQFAGSEAGVNYKVETVIKYGNGSSDYRPISGKVMVMGLPGSTLEGHFSGVVSNDTVDLVEGQLTSQIDLDETFLADNTLSLSGGDLKVGLLASGDGAKKSLSLMLGGEGNLGILKANRIFANEYFDKTMLRVTPAYPYLNLLELKDQEGASMVFQVMDESYAEPDAIFATAFELYDPDNNNNYERSAYLNTVDVSPNFYSFASVSHNIQVFRNTPGDERVTGDLKIGMSSYPIEYGETDLSGYVKYDSSDFIAVGKKNKVQLTPSGSILLNGNANKGYQLDVGDGNVLVEGEVLGRLAKIFYGRCLPSTSNILSTDKSYVEVIDKFENETIVRKRAYLEERANLKVGGSAIDYTPIPGGGVASSGGHYFQARDSQNCLINKTDDVGWDYGYGLKRTILNNDLKIDNAVADIRWQFRVIITVSGSASSPGTYVQASAFGNGTNHYGDKVYFSGDNGDNTKSIFTIIEEFKNCNGSACVGYSMDGDPEDDAVVFNVYVNEDYPLLDQYATGVFTGCLKPQDSQSEDDESECEDETGRELTSRYYWSGSSIPSCNSGVDGIDECSNSDNNRSITHPEKYDISGFSASILIFATPYVSGSN